VTWTRPREPPISARVFSSCSGRPGTQWSAATCSSSSVSRRRRPRRPSGAARTARERATSATPTRPQSAFLAHAFVESDQFRRLTEATAGQECYREYPTDEERLDVGGLEKLYKPGTKNRRTIDPIGDWSFIGRGPLQVTHRANYVQTLAYLEKQAEAEEAAGRKDRAVRLRETVDAVKADPKQASNPRHTFLFSAAYMRMAGGDVRSAKKSAKTFGGTGAESVWMTGGHTDPQATKKAAAWGRALEALDGS
jgi:predicted chitinase